ncbi:AAEL010922-PA, partial [Aedes aegypti]
LKLISFLVIFQFWAAYVPCEAQHKDAVQITLEQIDVIKRLTERYSPHLTACASVHDIVQAHKNHQMCSLIGVEGGHSLGGSLGVLRIYYALGVRYMTLTSTCHTPWADSSNADGPKYDIKHGGLTAYGKYDFSPHLDDEQKRLTPVRNNRI